MPLKTGATAQLDAPEEAAVAALIAAAPAPTHDLGGASHNADTLADLNTKVTDADLVALAGQLGGSSASPDIRGVRETDGPTLLTVGDLFDGQIPQRIGTAFKGGQKWAAALPGDFATVQEAMDAYAGSDALFADMFIDGDLSMGANTVLSYPSMHFQAKKKGAGNLPKIIMDERMCLCDNGVGPGSTVERPHFKFTSLHLVSSVSGKQILSKQDGVLIEMDRCILETGVGFALAAMDLANGDATWILRDCEFDVGDVSWRIFDFNGSGGGTGIINLILINCREVSGTAAGKLGRATGNPVTVNLHLLGGTRISSLGVEVSTGRTLNVYRDGASEMDESLFTGTGTINIVRVAGDQLRETSGPTLLDMGAVADAQHFKRSGGDVVGETLGSFRLLSSLAHSATTGQGTDDHHAKLHKGDHKSGGADAFAAADLLEAVVKRLRTTTGPTDLLVGAVVDGEFLKRSGTALISALAVQLQSESEDLVEQTKAGTTFTQAFRHSFTPAVAGDYLIMWGCRLRTASSGKVADMLSDLDDGTILGSGSVSISGVGDLFASQSNFAIKTLTAAAHTVDLDYRLNPNTSGDTAKIDDMRVAVFGPL